MFATNTHAHLNYVKKKKSQRLAELFFTIWTKHPHSVFMHTSTTCTFPPANIWQGLITYFNNSCKT